MPNTRVLIIDGDQATRSALAARFRHRHTTCDEVGSFAEALQRCTLRKYDAIVLELTLPDSSNPMETCHRLQELCSEYVIVWTSSGDSQTVQLAAQNGALDFFVKGMHPDVLIARVDNLVNRRDPTPEHSAKLYAVREDQAQEGMKSTKEETLFRFAGISMTERALFWFLQIVMVAGTAYGGLWLKSTYVSKQEYAAEVVVQEHLRAEREAKADIQRDKLNVQLQGISDAVIGLNAKMRRDDEQDAILKSHDERIKYLERK